MDRLKRILAVIRAELPNQAGIITISDVPPDVSEQYKAAVIVRLPHLYQHTSATLLHVAARVRSHDPSVTAVLWDVSGEQDRFGGNSASG